MKTIKLFLVAVFLSLATWVSATEKPTLNVIQVEGEKLLVAFHSENTTKVNLTIKDSEGNTIYYKSTRRPVSDLRQLYDISNLENGTYLFQVGVNDYKISRKVTINQDQLSVSEPVFFYPPLIKINDRLLDIIYLNQGLELLTLKIYKGNELVYTTGLGDQFVVKNRFDMGKLPSGSYQIILETGTEVFPYYANL